MSNAFPIMAGSLAFLLIIFLGLLLARAFQSRRQLQGTGDRPEHAEDSAWSAQQQAELARSTGQHASVSAAPRSSLSYERFPHLSATMQQAKARRELLTTLSSPLALLLNGCLARAIDLSCEQSGVSRTEGAQIVADLLGDVAGEPSSSHLSFPNGADPLVTLLLLHADCRNDALRYFCLSSGASPAEARDALATLQPIAEHASWFFFEEGMIEEPPLDPASLHFLIRAGYLPLAIRYYRRRTAAGLAEAKQAVEEIARQLS